MKNMWERFFFKTLTDQNSIGWNLASINRKTNSIDTKSIEHWSSQANSNLNFYRIFDWSSYSFDQLKILKFQTFEKQSSFMQKLLKPQYFMNEMHECELKSFSKTLEFNLDLPKTKIFNQFVHKTQALNIFCNKNKKQVILDGQNKSTHYIMY